MPRKFPPKDAESTSEADPQPGTAGPGELIDPITMPEDPESAEPATDKSRPAPAPGVPVSAEEYERLKQKAKHGPPPPADHAQEDRPKKK